MERPDLLERIGRRVRASRLARGLTLKQLAARAELSERFVGQLERGQANIAVSRLADVADALDVRLVSLIDEGQGGLAANQPGAIVALLGVRGAGKSTVGRRLAKALQVEFLELDAHIEEASGLSLAEIFAIHGEPYYRHLEHELLLQLRQRDEPAIIATGGSLVSHPESWEVLADIATTVWLRATARDHWERVVAQGDTRPMAENPQAFQQLEALLVEREPLYRRAEVHIDTSGRDVAEVVTEAIRAVRARQAA